MDWVHIRQVAHTLGLNAHTVEDLLKKGWTYSETLGHPARWEAPTTDKENT